MVMFFTFYLLQNGKQMFLFTFSVTLHFDNPLPAVSFSTSLFADTISYIHLIIIDHYSLHHS